MAASDHLNEQQFLRFGDWPTDERSRNHAEGWKEAGVSVYEIHPHNNMPMDPDPYGESDNGDTGAGMRARVTRWRRGAEPAHVVSGEQVGIGHDGEPLLNRLKHHGPWTGPT